MLDEGVARRLIEDGRRIVVTGAGGWLGLATIDMLHKALGDAFADRVACFGSTRRDLILRGGVRVTQARLDSLAALPPRPSMVLHLAFLTKDRAEAMDEASYRAANMAITRTVLDALPAIGAEGAFVASSGAATKADDPAASAAMRLYGAMKRDDETAFAEWAEGAGTTALIGRIYNITGPYINKHQAYAIANFIVDALDSRPIKVLAPRPVVRGYSAIRDLMSLVFGMLLDDEGAAVRFDSGGEVLELGDVAGHVAAVLGGTVDRAPITRDDTDHYVGDDQHYRALLDRQGIVAQSLDDQIRETAEYIRGARHDG
ncbi:MAG: hypothetical protein DI569_09190 [Sphingopyxis macrogoltabida]|uniref:NAD-dependent epimerase/dehydratase domain-containing protein n=1 Tax=Sphingopyxis macrogoltabida TaxID=33050 RepID=A0A2W5KYU4_SPHMC|nr:MAG: hypothetical protein DI569_09190 [Sphingopyxis macrogoltabida]